MSGPGEGERSAEVTRQDQPRIYVASLTDYNAGILHGSWLDADSSVAELAEGIETMLAASPITKRYGEVAEEYAIHDYEGFGPHLRLGEWEPLERIVALADGLGQHGDAFGAWVAQRDDDVLPLTEAFEEHYCGEFASAEDYGTQLLDELGIDLDSIDGVLEGHRPYIQIDVAGWVRDMVLGGDIDCIESKAGVYVFWTER